MKITAIISALAAATLVSAGKFHDLGNTEGTRVVPGAYIIEYQSGVNHRDLRNALNSRKVSYKVRNQYNVFHGSAISVRSKHNGKDLAAFPGVKNVWPVTLFSIPKIPKSTLLADDPSVSGVHVITGVDKVHQKYKLTGKGVKVGVIDSGIDYKHPAFAADGETEGCFGKDCRIAYGWDFVGDAYTGVNPVPDADPRDCQGHGSHVAGIIGGDALNINVSPRPPQPFVGVAPEVTLGSYRVFGCKGGAGDDVILAAMERAFNDGMDIINMSLGGGSAYKYNPTAILGEKLIANGLILVGAAGNDGSQGPWMVSDTGLGDNASSIASFDYQSGRGVPSSFSSFGLDGELRSKPDFAAPGGNILSTYPLAKGGYTVMSGTSMATPYAAGSHALWIQHKNYKPRAEELRLVFKNTATISSNARSNTAASASKQGAGLINVLRAIETTSSISPDHIDLLDSVNFRKSVKVTIKNSGSKTEAYALSHIPADTLNWYSKGNKYPTSAPLIEANYATVSFSQNKVQIAAGKSAEVTLLFSEPKKGNKAQFPIYSGYVVATPDSGSVPVSVPYIGLKGDVSKVPIIDTDLGFPGLGLLDKSGKIRQIPSGFVFDMVDNKPVVQTRLGSHTPLFSVRVFDANNAFRGFLTSNNGQSAVGSWVGRQEDVDEKGQLVYSTWIWNGSVLPTTSSNRLVSLPSGSYRIVVASQRKLSKGVYPGDFEIFDLGSVRF